MFKKRIGIFGGSFDPPHNGHIHVIELCLKKLNLDKILLIPSYQTPHKSSPQITIEKRFDMIKKACILPQVEVNDIELKRKHVSYTIDTIEELSLSDDIFLILGEDLCENLPQWKKFDKLIQKVNIVIIQKTESKSRHFSQKYLPLFKKYIHKKSNDSWVLKTETQFIFLQNNKYQQLSSSLIRNKLRLNLPLKQDIPIFLQKDIYNNYKYLTSVGQIELKKNILNFLNQKGALQPKLFEFNQKFLYEYIIISSGLNTRHVKALSSSLIEHLKHLYGIEPTGIEGEDLHQWIVLDYDFMIIHIFYDYFRNYYQLENLFKERTSKKPQ